MPSATRILEQVLDLPHFDTTDMWFVDLRGAKGDAQLLHKAGCVRMAQPADPSRGAFRPGRRVLLCDCVTTRRPHLDLSPWQHALSAAADMDHLGGRTARATDTLARIAAIGDRDGAVSQGSWDVSTAHDDLWPSTSYGVHIRLTRLRQRLLAGDVPALSTPEREALTAAEALLWAAMDEMRTAYLSGCAGIDLAGLWSEATGVPTTGEQFVALTHTAVHRRAASGEGDSGMPMKERALRSLTWAAAPHLGIRPWRDRNFTSMLIVLPDVALDGILPHLIGFAPLTEPLSDDAVDVVLRTFGESLDGFSPERFAEIITAARFATL